MREKPIKCCDERHLHHPAAQPMKAPASALCVCRRTRPIALQQASIGRYAAAEQTAGFSGMQAKIKTPPTTDANPKEPHVRGRMVLMVSGRLIKRRQDMRETVLVAVRLFHGSLTPSLLLEPTEALNPLLVICLTHDENTWLRRARRGWFRRIVSLVTRSCSQSDIVQVSSCS